MLFHGSLNKKLAYTVWDKGQKKIIIKYLILKKILRLMIHLVIYGALLNLKISDIQLDIKKETGFTNIHRLNTVLFYLKFKKLK